jgi:hypothetical protein
LRAALAFAVLAAAAALPGPSPAAGAPHACSLLLDGLNVKQANGILLYGTKPDPGNNAISCSRSQDKPLLEPEYSVRFWFVPYPRNALDDAWRAAVKSFRSGKSPGTRLRGFGADDAYLFTGSTGSGKRREEKAGIAWRKGVYIGGRFITEPSPSSGFDELDETAPLILRGALRRMPRK